VGTGQIANPGFAVLFPREAVAAAADAHSGCAVPASSGPLATVAIHWIVYLVHGWGAVFVLLDIAAAHVRGKSLAASSVVGV
jgi:hypothetical protein